MDAALWSEVFHADFVKKKKFFVVSWEFSSKQNYGKKEEIPGKIFIVGSCCHEQEA